MKKILLFAFLFFVLFLSSCSLGSTKESSTISGLTLIENKDFSINIPENWDIISSTGNSLPNPKNGEITLAAASKELKYGFNNNILILSQNLDKQITSTDFSVLNNVGSTKEYLEYLKIDSKSIEFQDNDKSNLYVFEAKYNIKTPKLKFLQIGKVCGISKGFLITVSLSTDIKSVSKYEEIVKSFKCK